MPSGLSSFQNPVRSRGKVELETSASSQNPVLFFLPRPTVAVNDSVVSEELSVNEVCEVLVSVAWVKGRVIR